MGDIVTTTITAARPRTRTSRIQIVDYYRFAAAIMVIAYHYFFGGIAGGKITSIEHVPGLVDIAKYGYLGVDLFFLISGFVIAQSAVGKTARKFAVDRMVRLYPAFWTGMLLTALVVAVWGAPVFAVTVQQVAANLTMMPTVFRQLPVDGVYWTLVFEIKFYALIGLLVFFNQAKRLATLMPLWAIGMAVLSFAAPALSERVDFLGSFYLLFAAGAIIASVRAGGWTVLRAVGLAAAFAASLPLELSRANGIADNRGVVFDPVVILILTTLFFVMLLATTSRSVATLTLPGATLAGALTYPVYLVHAHIGYIVLQHVATEENKWWVYAALIVSVIGVSYLIHRVVERGMKAQWFGFFDATVGRVVGGAEALFQRLRGGTGPNARLP